MSGVQIEEVVDVPEKEQEKTDVQPEQKKNKKKKKKKSGAVETKDEDGLEKLFRCFACEEMNPASKFSQKQLKLKGKRKCLDCLNFIKLREEATAPITKAKLALLEEKGNSTVKHVSAEALRQAQISDKNAADANEDKYAVFLNWLNANGAVYPALQLKFYTVDYRGVHAKTRLGANERCLTVPHAIIMTTEKAKACEIGQAMARAGGNSVVRSSHSWLAAMLLQEKHNPNSFWKPYIDTLPVHYRNMPMFFDEEELKELQGSFTLEMISNRKISLKMEYDLIAKACPEFAQYHHLDFVWARLAVITRIFGFEIGLTKTDGLVPMADMLNHKRPHETMWTYDNGVGGFTITTTKRLLKGAQIFDSYGRKCNSRYFVNYGFSLDQNEDNQVAMNFGVLSNDPLAARKTQMLGGRSRRRWQIPFDHRERVAARCLSYLRIVHADEEELNSVTDVKGCPALSTKNEARVLLNLGIEAKRTMSGFPTTLEEDNKLLEDPDGTLTMNIRNCIIMRRGEKEVLHAYMNLAPMAQTWDTFKALKSDFNSKIKNMGREPSFEWRLENYVKETWYPLFTGTKIEWEETSNAHED